MPSELQSSTPPPLQPSYILRGHTAQIHAVHFLRQNLRLLTGDADGWVVLWSLPIKRPIAVWRAHTATVLGLSNWGDDRVITHGRDGKVHIWQIREADEPGLSRVLPIDDAFTERKQPWLLHTLLVNAINFCAFALTSTDCQGILIATPGVQDGSINVTSFPAESRVATIPAPKGTDTGMLMAVGLYHANDGCGSGRLTVIGAYESGHAAVFRQNAAAHWECLYIHKAHSQPVLSLGILPVKQRSAECGAFLTSSADAVIARHDLPSLLQRRPNVSSADPESLQTKHAGQQSLTVRSDQMIFATAGWDSRVRVYSAKSMKELAVLKWHKEGCYAVAFAEVLGNHGTVDQGDAEGELTKRDSTVAERRMEKTKSTHWLAAGSKDGKVSLWEVY